MKKLLYLLVLLCLNISFGQQIEKIDNKYYVDGTHVYRHELKTTLQSNLKALALYNKARKKESIGGLLLGAGAGLLIADGVKTLVSAESYPSTFSYVGIGLVGISIPVLSGREKMMQESIRKFNAGPEEIDLGFSYDLELVTNSKGIGFKLTF